MNRRGFLGAMLAAGVAPAIVRASSLMKVSGIVIPTTEEVMAIGGWGGGSTLLTPAMITRESLRMLEHNLIMANRVNRSYEQQFIKIGDTLTISKTRKV